MKGACQETVKASTLQACAATRASRAGSWALKLFRDMRFSFLVLCCWAPVAGAIEPLTIPLVQQQSLHISNTGTPQAALTCTQQARARPKPPARDADASEIPAADAVSQALQNDTDAYATGVAPVIKPPTSMLPGPNGWRIAVWGDSHMAAAFFSEQMARKLVPPGALLQSRFIHAGVGHAGVRGLVRQACLEGAWSREMAHAHADAAAAPGPGMTSLMAQGPGASLGLDLRDAQGLPQHTRLKILYHGDGSDNIRLAIRVDNGPETEVQLDTQPGPHALSLRVDQAVSTLQMRLVSGRWRFQGIEWPEASTQAPYQLDLFAYPGATMAAWVRSDLAYLASWFAQPRYDLALIAFGTNEGNDPQFNPKAYRELLSQAVGRFRQVFPQTPCVLIGPGDRGIRVAKSKNKAHPKNRPTGPADTPHQHAKTAPQTPPPNLLKYARLHAQIGRIQAEVAALQGCAAWPMQSAMGGMGSAYLWARKSPPWVAPDLIHFTPAGYRELANRFMADFGLTTP